jgi:hypothetical protein
MADYVTTEELSDYLLGASAAADAKKASAVTRASRLFDRLCGVPNDYFSVADADPTTKLITGNGSTILNLPPFVGSLGVVIYEPETDWQQTIEDTFFVLKGRAPNQTLETFRDRRFDAFDRLDYFDWQRDWEPTWGWHTRSVWRENRHYSISARWGWEAVPEDVKAAVTQIAISLMRDLDFSLAQTLGSKDHSMNHLPAGSIAALTVEHYREQMVAGFAI